jgi:hypothetical protein
MLCYSTLDQKIRTNSGLTISTTDSEQSIPLGDFLGMTLFDLAPAAPSVRRCLVRARQLAD